MKRASLVAILLLALLARPSGQSPADGLSIYFIDVEGGQSTLIVAPTGESMLVDAGYADNDRDPNRILAAAHDAGIRQIDTLLVTHFHADHDGGVPGVARQIPIKQFLDDGDVVRTPEAIADRDWLLTLARYNAYVQARGRAPHVEPQPGYQMKVGAAQVTFVSHDGKTITQPLPGGGESNAACPATAPDAQEKIENPRSNGFVLQFGRFRFLDLGDLVGQPLFALLCPRSLIGPVDLYLIPHHGGVDTWYPATFAGFHPRVAIINNGPLKGGAPEAFDAVRHAPGLEATFQLHASRLPGSIDLPPSQISNLDDTTSYWIKVIARENGSFTVVNARTRSASIYSDVVR
jgi:beta-lactamase superfamily II metal-dependent hydrolase